MVYFLLHNVRPHLLVWSYPYSRNTQIYSLQKFLTSSKQTGVHSTTILQAIPNEEKVSRERRQINDNLYLMLLVDKKDDGWKLSHCIWQYGCHWCAYYRMRL